jgi:hypothetical protein
MAMDLAAAAAGVLATLGIILPGAAVLAWQTGRRRDPVEIAAVSFGTGMSVIALAALLGRTAGIRISLPILIAFEVCSAVLMIAGLARRKIRLGFPPLARLAVCAVLVLLVLRFHQARGLALPAWVDSVHHVWLVRLFLDRGGIPGDLEPWIPGPFYYHYGFHASAAVFSALAFLTPDRAVLIFGQILNAAAALSVYRLAMAFRIDRRRALLAMALAGFFSQMPAYYLTWGRYTLLAGMVLLPLAAAEAVEFATKAPRVSTAVRLALLTAGLLLTHYLAALLLALFFVLLGAYLLVRGGRRKQFVGLAGSVAAGTALALPWLVPMMRASSVGVGVDVVASTESIDAAYFAHYADYLWKLLGPLRNYVFLGTGLISAAAALFRRGPLKILAVWGLLLGVQTLPWGLRIEPFRPDHLAIVLFLPAAVLAADGFLSLAEAVDRRLPAFSPRFFFAGIALAACLIGVWQTREIVNPATVFADADDRRAALWVAENTPADAVFLINAAYWQNGLYRGVDGGWWLLPLASRRTLLLPMLYSFADPAYRDSINRLGEEISSVKGCSDALWSLVREQGVTYLYIKEGSGLLQPADLVSCPGIEEVYRVGKVRVYRVVLPAG